MLNKLQYLCLMLSLFSVLFAASAKAEVKQKSSDEPENSPFKISHKNEFPQPATTVKEWLSQSPTSSQSPALVTGVRITQTKEGIEVILDTKEVEKLQPASRSEGNSIIIDIPNAQLRSQTANTFKQEKPIAGITEISVINNDAKTIRLTVKGETALPKVELFDSDEGLIFSVISENAAQQRQQSETPQNPVTQPETQKQPEQPSAESNEPIELVVTATRTEEDVENIPRSVTVITREQIEQQTTLSRDIQDILGNAVPGLGASSQVQGNFSQTLRGRGTQILVDGIPISQNNNTGFGRDLRSIEPGVIERVEVVRGPSAVYGDGATGGVINIITRKAKQGITSTTEIGTTASLTHPSESFGYNLSHTISGTEGKFDYTASFGLTTTGSYFDAEGDLIPGAGDNSGDSTTLNVLGKLGVNLSDTQRLQLTFNHFKDTQNPYYIADPVVDTIPGKQKARALRVGEFEFIGTSGLSNTTTLASVDYTNQNLLGSKVQATGYYRNTKNQGSFYDARTFDPSDLTPIERWVQSSERLGGRLQVETPVFKSVSLLWGADYSHERNFEFKDIFDTNEFDSSGKRVFRKVSDSILAPEHTIKTLGLFAQAQWEISPQFILSGGLRHERFDVDIPNYTNDASEAIEGGKRNINGTVFNGGLVYKATDEISLFTNFAQGFSIPPIARILYNASAGFNFGRDIDISQPIKVNNYEIGVRGNWNTVQASLSAFYSDSELGATTICDGSSICKLVRAPQRNYGIEGTLDWKPTDKFKIGGIATLVEGDNDLDDDGKFKPMDNFVIPPFKLNVYVEHQTTPGWLNRLQAQYIGSRDRGFKEGVDLVPIESYVTVDYISNIKLGSGTLELGVQNLLNNQYQTVNAQVQSGFSDIYAIAAKGRTLSVNYRITW